MMVVVDFIKTLVGVVDKSSWYSSTWANYGGRLCASVVARACRWGWCAHKALCLLFKIIRHLTNV